MPELLLLLFFYMCRQWWLLQQCLALKGLRHFLCFHLHLVRLNQWTDMYFMTVLVTNQGAVGFNIWLECCLCRHCDVWCPGIIVDMSLSFSIHIFLHSINLIGLHLLINENLSWNTGWCIWHWKKLNFTQTWCVFNGSIVLKIWALFTIGIVVLKDL